jgi:cholest-4-en-3-one 26-monooxygenase
MDEGDLSKIDLTDLDHFAAGAPHRVFSALREAAPLHWNEHGEFWSVLRHADVLAVSRDFETFSAALVGNMIFDQFVEPDARARMMIELDPPAHTRYRKLVNRGFTPRTVQRLEDFARRTVGEILDRVLEEGRCDLVSDVAGRLPLEMIAELMGVPASDRLHVYEIANRVMAFNDPEFGGAESGAGENSDAMGEMYAYAEQLVLKRSGGGAADITGILLQADLSGDELTKEEFQLFFLLLIVAGIETTRSAIAISMLAFDAFPGEWKRLREEPGLLDSAVEEVIRWATPVQHFRRTATRDVELGGETIRAGQRVVVWYTSANRDDRVFRDPFVFDVGRMPNEHLSFGYGRHFCLGASLARLEVRTYLAAMIERGVEVEEVGGVDWMRSNFAHSPKRMPIRLRRSTAL